MCATGATREDEASDLSHFSRKSRAKAGIADALNRRLLSLHGWLEWSGWIYGIWKGAGSSILAVEFLYDFLLEPCGFLNLTFAL